MSNWDRLVTAVRTREVEAPALRPAMLAQCILESGRGTSRLALEHNNFTGLKYRPEMEGFATRISYQAHDGVDDYCAFASPEAFVPGYWKFISRSVYAGWQAHAQDPAGYIAFLKARGYAGDPNYVGKVVALFDEARRLLAEAPGAAGPAGPADPGIDEPIRPPAAELVDELADLMPEDAEPRFESIASVAHRWQGTRPRGIEGAIVHYDAGRARPSTGPDNPDAGARQTLAGAVANGYAFVTVSRGGKIYLPSNMDWNKWGYHAGPSQCPATHRSGVSQYYVGFEVNSPGFVYPTADPDLFVPWFEAVLDARRNVVLDARGRATVRNPGGELYRAAQLRHVPANNGNIKRGVYVPYTQQQMDALIGVMLWLKRQYPASFRLDYVFGHDEVAPTRKLDPGGSLGALGSLTMTMADFRVILQQAWERQQA